MGRYVAKMQKDSKKPSRLWNIEDFEDVVSSTVITICGFCMGPCQWKQHGVVRFKNYALAKRQ
ncbi:hypothetical protein H5410_030114 [Solanum commersonii]|uniref:Uncharacterized protein n=1 Tax=Solanum commersonii TaxID=4109 RepID=A0A9J5YGI8_SOLCO|nr:hypothetical protein H5410_030114 [Solanum commersonii]